MNIYKKLMIGATLVFGACTDLEIEEKDSIVIQTETGSFQGVVPGEALVNSYNDINGYGDQANWYALNEITSDELLVPTRGTDWGDNGVWRTLHAHTWDATHSQIKDTWNNLNSNVYRLNQILHPASKAKHAASDPLSYDQEEAEAKFLRAVNMFWIVDFWRQVPFRTPDDAPDKDPDVKDAAAAVDFIIADLTAAIPNLPASSPNYSATKKATKAAAYFLLAKIYLNKHIYLGTTADAADMTKVIEYVDLIKAAGFNLQDGFFELFEDTQNNETIWWVPTSVGNRIWCGLHYNQPTPDNTGGGWNGFATTAEFYALFEGDANSNTPGSGQEERRGFVPNTGGYYAGYGMLIGQQYGIDGAALKDRQGNPLVYTKEYANTGAAGMLGNGEKEGVRVLKYNPGSGPGGVKNDPDNGGAYTSHEVLFRYADAHLMKIEAILRGGTSSDNAQTLFTELRAIRHCSNTALAATLDEVLKERGRELYIEGWRRNDLVRFGTYEKPYGLKDDVDPTRNVFPVPSLAISSNPNLVQNPGY